VTSAPRGEQRSRSGGAYARDSAAVRVPRLSRETWVLVAIVAVGTALRCVWVAYAARPLGFPLGGDPLGYALRADQLANGDGYISFFTREPTAFQPPGWPMLLAGWYWIAQHTPLPDDMWNMAGVLNVAISAASIPLLFAIGRRLFDSRIGLLAAGMYALWPNLIFYTGVPQLELFFVFLLLLVIWLLLHYGWPRAQRIPPVGLVLAGFATGAMLLVRPFGGVVIVAMVVTGIVAGRGWRRTLVDTAILCGAAALVLLPWTVRNAVELDGFVPVATNLGETFCIGHQPRADGQLVGDTEYCVGPYDASHITDPHVELKRNSYTMRQGLKFAFGHPVDEARLVFWRGYFMLRHDHDGVDAVESSGTLRAFSFIPKRPRAVLVTIADGFYFAISVLALLAVPWFARRRRPERLLVLLTGVGLFLVPLGLYGLPRFKVPLAPFVALGAAVTLGRVIGAGNERRRTAPASSG
jgi:4-amino-4-deoxy-L-arabinose transferase-like glycosyltransferase